MISATPPRVGGGGGRRWVAVGGEREVGEVILEVEVPGGGGAWMDEGVGGVGGGGQGVREPLLTVMKLRRDLEIGYV